MRMLKFTRTPDMIFDELMSQLTDCELRVLLVIVRKTCGWNRMSAPILDCQFAELTGRSEKHIHKAKASLLEKGYIIERRPKNLCGISEYALAEGVLSAPAMKSHAPRTKNSREIDSFDKYVDDLLSELEAKHPDWVCERCGEWMIDYKYPEITVCIDCVDAALWERARTRNKQSGVNLEV